LLASCDKKASRSSNVSSKSIKNTNVVASSPKDEPTSKGSKSDSTYSSDENGGSTWFNPTDDAQSSEPFVVDGAFEDLIDCDNANRDDLTR
jgi:hypothetical protein